MLAWMGTAHRLVDPQLLLPHDWKYVLPVGISFFTFQSMSYTIDFYLGKTPRERESGCGSLRLSVSIRS